MKKISVREEGLVGTLLYKGNPKSAVIVLGGSGGGLCEIRAEQLANHGFASLALAYFAVESLPATLKQIPLEYFGKAIKRLRNEPGINRIGIWGGSRGAELALILGTIFADQLDAIVAQVPSSVVYGTFDSPDGIAWVYQGKPIAPSAPFSLVQNAKGDSRESAIAATPSFLNSMQDQVRFRASAIQVEKLRCPLLLISAEDDQMWPSFIFAKQIIERLVKYRSTISYSHLSYPKVGHSPSKGTVGLHPIMKRWVAFGGRPKDNAWAAVDWLKQTVHFFKKQFQDNT